MAWIRLSGQTSEVFNFQPLMLDEFVPLVEFDKTAFDSSNGYLSADSKDTTFSEYIDEALRKITPKVIDTKKRKIKIPFNVKKGSSKSDDSEGVIDVKLSISDPDVQINGKKSFSTSYKSSFELEIEIKKTTDTEFYIDFYANDDNDSNKGELADIFCGRVKVVFVYTIITDWDTIASVIPKSKFIGWGHPGVEENCFHYVVEQLKQVGHKVKSGLWNKGTTKNKILNDYIYQTYLEKDVAGMKKGIQKNHFISGVEYLKKTLKAGTPVMVGVDDGSSRVNPDLTTEHYVTIVGMGEDIKGKYFLFYDNAIPSKEIGTSVENKLYCEASQYLITGKGDLRNIYIQRSPKKEYIVTQIRETQ